MFDDLKTFRAVFPSAVLSVYMCSERIVLPCYGTHHTTTDNRLHNFRLQITSGMLRLRYRMANTLRKKQILTPRTEKKLCFILADFYCKYELGSLVGERRAEVRHSAVDFIAD